MLHSSHVCLWQFLQLQLMIACLVCLISCWCVLHVLYVVPHYIFIKEHVACCCGSVVIQHNDVFCSKHCLFHYFILELIIDNTLQIFQNETKDLFQIYDVGRLRLLTRQQLQHQCCEDIKATRLPEWAMKPSGCCRHVHKVKHN